MKRALLWLLVTGSCGNPTQPVSPPAHVATAEPGPPEVAPQPSSSAAAKPERPPEPKGPAAFALHVEPGRRQPLSLTGSVLAIRPPTGGEGLDAWTEVTLSVSGKEEKLYLSFKPTSLALPFSVGERLGVEIDCRKGGWHRVCDGVVRDMARRTLLIASGSGDEESAPGWKVERGAVATSQVRPTKERSVEHTHSLRFQSEKSQVTAMPHEWRRVIVYGKSYLVTGYEVVWEGERPLDARDHRTFAIVLERAP